MIRDVGNIELCELLETEPKTQCKACVSYWNIGIVYCTCGHFLHKETEVNRKFVKYTMDLLSVLEYVIKKGRPHGHRYGRKPGDKEEYLANQLKKKCQKWEFLTMQPQMVGNLTSSLLYEMTFRGPYYHLRTDFHNRPQCACPHVQCLQISYRFMFLW